MSQGNGACQPPRNRVIANPLAANMPMWSPARWVFTVRGALILAALVLSAAIYRAELDYRFEVMSLCITWLVLIVAGTLLTVQEWPLFLLKASSTRPTLPRCASHSAPSQAVKPRPSVAP